MYTRHDLDPMPSKSNQSIRENEVTKNIITKLYAGDKVGRLTILEVIPGYLVPGHPPVRKKARCLCDCGNKYTSRYDSIRNQHTKSCGCIVSVIHGGSYTPEYNVWNTMRTRCNNSNSSNYSSYGGRGIKVCERWSNSFVNFITDMGKRPSPKHSIDRVNNELGYSPSNCKWVLAREQQGNKRDTNPSVKKNCLSCDKIFHVMFSKINKTKYCSMTCRRLGGK